MKAVATLSTRSPAHDYLELCKPRLSLFVLIVVAVSAWMGGGAGGADALLVVHAVVGTALVAAGGSALNMLLERGQDARMARTALRPLPSGRLSPREVLVFGLLTSGAGLLHLLLFTTPVAAALGASTLLLYVGVYTPLKRRTTLNTHIGAIPGALPALIGWAAVAGQPGPGAYALFLLVYVWQIPHFLSIAWLYRDDYRAGGFRMLSVVDPHGGVTGRQALLGVLALLPVSLLPVLGGGAGLLYASVALLLGAWFVRAAIAFALSRTVAHARALLRTSLLYLPPVLLAMLLDRTF